MTKLCECGCGLPAPINTRNSYTLGIIKGEPRRFIKQHHRWNGGIRYGQYIHVAAPNHPRASSGGYVAEHILIAEKVLGKPLPPRANVHHVNERKWDNRNANLVICENHAYHMLLHQRMRALAACGHAKWRKCKYCKRYDDPARLFIRSDSSAYHRECDAERAQKDRRRLGSGPQIRYTNADILRELQRVAVQLGSNTLSRPLYDLYGRIGCSTVTLHFGSWQRAVEAAGLKIGRRGGAGRQDRNALAQFGALPRRRA